MKKGISQSKVNRMRSLVSGDYTAKTKISSGYTTKTVERVEGNVWEERGKTWTIKKGIKQTVNKLDEIRLKNHLPLVCPKCSNTMKEWRDRKAYSHFNTCTNCLAKFEAKLKLNGSWETYKREVQDANFKSWVEDQYQQFTDFMKARTSNNMITEAGDIESWDGALSEEFLKKNFEDLITKVEKERYENRKK